MRMEEDSEKAGLKLNSQKTKIMASGPTTSWQIDGEKVEAVTNFIFLGSKITVDSDCNYEIKRQFTPWKESYDKHIKNKDIPFLTKVHLVKAVVFPVIMYECKSWTIKKAGY